LLQYGRWYFKRSQRKCRCWKGKQSRLQPYLRHVPASVSSFASNLYRFPSQVIWSYNCSLLTRRWIEHIGSRQRQIFLCDLVLFYYYIACVWKIFVAHYSMTFLEWQIQHYNLNSNLFRVCWRVLFSDLPKVSSETHGEWVNNTLYRVAAVSDAQSPRGKFVGYCVAFKSAV